MLAENSKTKIEIGDDVIIDFGNAGFIIGKLTRLDEDAGCQLDGENEITLATEGGTSEMYKVDSPEGQKCILDIAAKLSKSISDYQADLFNLISRIND